MVKGLHDTGYDAVHVVDVDLVGANDERIICFARKEKMVILTHDKDFGNLIRFPVQEHFGVVLLRFRNQRPQNVLHYIVPFFRRYQSFKSKLVILREDSFRIIE